MKTFPILLAHELIPFHPTRGFYIESNGMKIFENENKELYDFAIKNHFDLIKKIKEDSKNLCT